LTPMGRQPVAGPPGVENPFLIAKVV